MVKERILEDAGKVAYPDKSGRTTDGHMLKTHPEGKKERHKKHET
jgi:hypothetical protein